MSLVNESIKPNAKRTTYGIDIRVGEFSFNEWGLHETTAKEVNELLTANGDKPLVVGAVTFTRRKPSELSAALAEVKAKMQPVNV